MTKKSVINSSENVTSYHENLSKILFFDARPAGSGKTYSELKCIVKNPGLYLFAVDRREAIKERRETINELRANFPSNIHVVEVSSQDYHEGTRSKPSVRVRIEALPKIYQTGHVLVFVTHEGLMSADLASFQGWSLVVDETPSIFEMTSLSSGLTWPWLQQYFQIIPGCDLNTIVPNSQTRTTDADIVRDSMTKVLASLHRRAASVQYNVFTDIDDWTSLSKSPTWRWSSVWSPAQLHHFERVIVLANAFDRSLTFKTFQAMHPDIAWESFERPTQRFFQKRRMAIHYFARGHCAQRGLFEKQKGQAHLSLIAEWVRRRVSTADHIWTCNERNRASLKRLPGTRLSPRQAGSNRYQEIDAVTMMYTAKPDPDECHVLNTLSVDTAAVKETREYETIYQFAGRCSVRDEKSNRDIQLYVYDINQAQYLAEMFHATGYVHVDLRPVDLGFLDFVYNPARGRKKDEPSATELAQRETRKREKARERKRKQREREAAARSLPPP